MKILFVVDARSPIARNWMRHFAERGDEVYIASTFSTTLDFPVKRMELIPVAFSGLKKATQRPGGASARTLGLRTLIRRWLGPLTIRRATKRLRAFIDEIQPDLVHAMRIPYEGMIAANACDDIPLALSTWGNDFTLHAPSTPLMRRYTRQALQAADAVHSDCRRDIRLAAEWRFDSSKLTLVAPGNGGIRSDIFYPPRQPVEEPIILNPRGFRAYVRNDMFFKSIPLVLSKNPKARFICIGMAGEEAALWKIKEYRIERSVELLGTLSQEQIAELYRRTQIMISPSIHDGTPNTLLESMACGCFPVAGDLESIREWITPNKNGLLFDSNDPQSIASAIIYALENKTLREESAELNREIISARAEYKNTMRRAEEFYERLLKQANKRTS
ncbi:MAG TPA: glycosyltransferase family 4 protein [Anaerolineales bacterium]|nr:glycosyltransferase family 4 protein [Anaerolineales bacterium]